MNLQLNFMKYNCRECLGFVPSSGGWITTCSEELLAEEALQGVCVRRKNAEKKHGGCSSRRMNIWLWLWLSHRSSSNTNW